VAVTSCERKSSPGCRRFAATNSRITAENSTVAAGEAVDQFLGKPLDARGRAVHLPGQEGRVHEPPEPGVPRRLECQERVPLELVKGRKVGGRLGPAEFLAAGHVKDLTAEASIAEQRVHVVVTSHAAMSELRPREHAAETPHRGVERIRIADERRIAGVEVEHGSGGHAIIMPAAGRSRPSGGLEGRDPAG
jgi:hypothetical protein